ncbi:MAG: hypothetical protein ACE5F6_10225 [Anaerolineae bacterium]
MEVGDPLEAEWGIGQPPLGTPMVARSMPQPSESGTPAHKAEGALREVTRREWSGDAGENWTTRRCLLLKNVFFINPGFLLQTIPHGTPPSRRRHHNRVGAHEENHLQLAGLGGEFAISGFTNKDLRHYIADKNSDQMTRLLKRLGQELDW